MYTPSKVWTASMVLVVVLGHLVGSGRAFYSPGDDVIELTDSNFNKLVLSSDDVWLVQFYAPWCGYCRNLAPHWIKAAAELKGKVNLGAVNIDVHKINARQYKLERIPTIIFFPGGPKDRNSAQQYPGRNTAPAIINYALKKYNDANVQDTAKSPQEQCDTN